MALIRPLFLAALRGQVPAFNALLAAGADPKRVTATNNTALIMACQGSALPDTKGDHLPIVRKVSPFPASEEWYPSLGRLTPACALPVVCPRSSWTLGARCTARCSTRG